jgi:pimeloyl-ACP methyl ester carboxylesterase
MVLTNFCDLRKGVRWIVLIVASTVATSGQQIHPTREFFYVGGKYSGPPDKELMAGQMYVEVLRPQRVTQKYPIVFFHGGGQTATNWMGTPDGRAGWADYFLEQGYVVYLTDQPARGRSPWHASTNGPLTADSFVSEIEHNFTAPEIFGDWPQAKKHNQWPGQGETKGRKGDPVFDAFYSTQVEGLTNRAEIQTLVQAAGSALLDKIGPAILVTHSQSGPFGWLLADSRPKTVKAIIAVEPSGPPFSNVVINVGKDDKPRPWGVADIPLTYFPPAKTASDLAPVREQVADGPDLAICWKQPDPPRQLPNLQSIPILIISTEASYHAVYDHCTSKYLTQAGVKHTYMRLEEQGIHGNGHMVMLEKNNLEVAAVIQKWISAYVK